MLPNLQIYSIMQKCLSCPLDFWFFLLNILFILFIPNNSSLKCYIYLPHYYNALFSHFNFIIHFVYILCRFQNRNKISYFICININYINFLVTYTEIYILFLMQYQNSFVIFEYSCILYPFALIIWVLPNAAKLP